MKDIFIQSICIEELINLKNIEINISKDEKKHLILIGENGSGKSILLERLRNYLTSIESNNYKNRLKVDEYKCEIEQLEKSDSILQENNINNLKEKLISYDWYEEEFGKGIDVKIFNSDTIQEKYNQGEFILAYFGVERELKVIEPKGIEKIELNTTYEIENKITYNFVKYLLDLKNQQSFAKYESNFNELKRLEKWFSNFEKYLRELMGKDDLELHFDNKNFIFSIIEKNKNTYGFNDLSAGYSSVLSIVLDLMMRMEKKSSGIYDLHGIVLIDEIEAHLHVQLQKKIMAFLTKLFPNIQFIITTHSPFIIKSLDNIVIYDLGRKREVENLFDYFKEEV